MKYRKLGHTDLEVSVICLGTMTWGEQNTEEEAHAQLDWAFSEGGVNFLDTAEMYPAPPRAETQGATESHIGTWLASRKNRSKVILATKVVGPSEFMKYIRQGPRLNRQHIKQAVTDSLSRLQTDYIDLYQLHWPERRTNFFGELGYVVRSDEDDISIQETLQVLAELVQAGTIRYVGVSNETPWGMLEFLRLAREAGLPRVVSIQNPYNLLNRSFEVGLAEIAYREKTGLLAYSPLGCGVLSGKYLGGARPANTRLALYKNLFSRYTNANAIKATEAYVQLAKKCNLDAAQMALAFVNSRPFVTSNIIGATTQKQLEMNVKSIDIELSEDVLKGIEQIHKQYSNPSP